MSDISDIDNNNIRIKLFVDNDWKFVTVRLKHTDMQYIRKNFYGKKISNPTLEKKYKKWFLRFAITEETKLHTKPIQEQRVLTIVLEHIMQFKRDFKGYCITNKQAINSLDDYRKFAIELI